MAETNEKVITYTDGKVFTLRTLDRLVERSRLAEFAAAPPGAE